MRKILFILITLAISYGQNTASLSYDGSDYLLNDTNYRSSDEQGAISVWYKPNNFSSAAYLFSSGYTASSSYFCGIYIYATTGEVAWVTDDPATVIIETNINLNVGEWNHILIRSDGSSTTAMINGVEATTSGTNTGLWFADVINRNRVIIGGLTRTSVSNEINGVVDELAVFSKKTTPAQDAQLYNNGTPTDVSGLSNLVDYWRFEEGTGTTSGPTTGSLTWQFGDGSTSSTFPTWSTETAGWDAGETTRGYEKHPGYPGY